MVKLILAYLLSGVVLLSAARFDAGQVLAFHRNAVISISPNIGTLTVGSTFEVAVLLDTADHTINAIDVTVEFPIDKLQVVSPSTGNSFVSLWLQQPTFSNKAGTIKFAGGVTGVGIKTSSGLISTIVFRVNSTGTATIRVSEQSVVLAGDGQGTTLPSTKSRAIFTLIPQPPTGPKVFSLTHPDEETWYQNNNVIIGWEHGGEPGNYSYTFSQEPSEIPDNIDETGETGATFPDVADGIWYFHIKQKRQNIYGDTTHFRVRVDTTRPAEFEPVISVSGGVSSKPAGVSFFTTDALSGLEHYEVAVFDRSKESGEAPIFVEATSPYQIPNIGLGADVRIVVRAYDRAGNVRDGVADFDGASFFLSTVKENYIGLLVALAVSLFLAGHFIVRHRKRRQMVVMPMPKPSPSPAAAQFTVARRNGNFL